MGWIDPRYEENQRRRWLKPDWQRWVRHDAHRSAPPSVQTKSFAARRIEQRQAAEAETALAAEQSALRESLARLRWAVADLKYELAWRRLCRKYGYNPEQPRRPKGDPEGPGEWVRVASSDGAFVTKPAAMRRGPIDKPPSLPLHLPLSTPAGPEPPRAKITISNNAQTGESTIDESTNKLVKRLEDVVNKLPQGSGPNYGTKVHTEFANTVRDQNLTGIGREGVEQTFPIRDDIRYGSRDSVRTDIVLRNELGEVVAIYDVKTGGATLNDVRIQELLDKVRPSWRVPIIELHVIRGASLKGQSTTGMQVWIIVARLWRPGLPSIADLVASGAVA